MVDRNKTTANNVLAKARQTEVIEHLEFYCTFVQILG
jgi:hypothetical protein